MPKILDRMGRRYGCLPTEVASRSGSLHIFSMNVLCWLTGLEEDNEEDREIALELKRSGGGGMCPVMLPMMLFGKRRR